MVEAHVTGGTGQGISGFFDRESVARVASVARSETEVGAGGFQSHDLFFAFDSQLMTAAAAFHAVDHRHRLPVRGGHGLECAPSEGVLAFTELFGLFLVAYTARFEGDGLEFIDIRGVAVTRSVASGTIDFVLAMNAYFPILNDVGRFATVAIDTEGPFGSRLGTGGRIHLSDRSRLAP